MGDIKAGKKKAVELSMGPDFSDLYSDSSFVLNV